MEFTDIQTGIVRNRKYKGLYLNKAYLANLYKKAPSPSLFSFFTVSLFTTYEHPSCGKLNITSHRSEIFCASPPESSLPCVEMSPPEVPVQMTRQFDAGHGLQKLNHNSPEKPRFPVVLVLIQRQALLVRQDGVEEGERRKQNHCGDYYLSHKKW